MLRPVKASYEAYLQTYVFKRRHTQYESVDRPENRWSGVVQACSSYLRALTSNTHNTFHKNSWTWVCPLCTAVRWTGPMLHVHMAVSPEQPSWFPACKLRLRENIGYAVPELGPLQGCRYNGLTLLEVVYPKIVHNCTNGFSVSCQCNQNQVYPLQCHPAITEASFTTSDWISCCSVFIQTCDLFIMHMWEYT